MKKNNSTGLIFDINKKGGIDVGTMPNFMKLLLYSAVALALIALLFMFLKNKDEPAKALDCKNRTATFETAYCVASESECPEDYQLGHNQFGCQKNADTDDKKTICCYKNRIS